MVAIAAEKLVTIHGFPITNSFVATICVSLFLIIIAYLFSRNVKLVPGKFQNCIEFIIEFLYNTANETTGDEGRTRAFFPIIATFFIFILFANWLGLLPIFNTIGWYTKEGFVAILRPADTDLNMTLAMAIISAVMTQYFAIKYIGLRKHLQHYFSFNPIYLYVGVLELISEFVKVISLSLRLYGNIIAGDIVISTFGALLPVIGPLPFMGLEVVVGFVQAAVFAMLSLAFTNILSQDLH